MDSVCLKHLNCHCFATDHSKIFFLSLKTINTCCSCCRFPHPPKAPRSITDINNYYAVDQQPYIGVSYYRLRQTDFDGHTERYDIAPVEIRSIISNVSVFPNPSKDELTVSFSSIEKRKEYVLTIYSVVGQIVHQQTVVAEQGFNQVRCNTSGFPIGMYFLAVGCGDEYQKLKFTKE